MACTSCGTKKNTKLASGQTVNTPQTKSVEFYFQGLKVKKKNG